MKKNFRNISLKAKKELIIILILLVLPISSFSHEITDLEEKIKKMESLIDDLEKRQKFQDVMGELQQTDEEKKEKEEDILDAAGREYTLANPGILTISYNVEYTGDTYDTLRQLKDENNNISTEVKHVDTHELTNSISVRYPLKNNITISAKLPFVSKYSATSKDSKKGIGIGDPSITFQYQPFKSGSIFPTTILSASILFPVGNHSFEIDNDDEIATGDGRYAVIGGVNFSKTIDPIMAFGGFTYSHYYPIEDLDYNPDEKEKLEKGYYIYKIDYGDSMGFNIGMGYSLSYMVSVTMSYQYSHTLRNTYYWKKVPNQHSSSSSSSTFSIGTNWRISSKRSFSTDLSMGLYNNNSDVSFSVNIPFDIKI